MACELSIKEAYEKQSVKKLLALMVCFFFIASSLLSIVFMLAYPNHEHDFHSPGDECTICMHLVNATKLVKLLFAFLICSQLVFGCLSAIFSTLKSSAFYKNFISLVHFKVRLNN